MNKKYQKGLDSLNPNKKMTASDALILGNPEETVDELNQTQLILEIMKKFADLTPKYQDFLLKEMQKAKKRPELPQLGNKSLLDLNETAYFLGVNSRTIYNWINNGKIQGAKKNGKWYFERNEVQRIMNEKK